MGKQTARGPHPKDQNLFGKDAEVKKLREAVDDLSWLLTKGYPENAALKLVGDRFKLTKRQRLAVRRSACSDAARAHRKETKVPQDQLGQSTVLIDGFNIIITLETILSEGYLFVGKDRVIRDISGVHGSYKLLGITREAVQTLVEFLKSASIAQSRWYFDQPVSNSGRLRELAESICNDYDLAATVETTYNPDRALVDQDLIVITSDSDILNRSRQWLDLSGLYYSINSHRIIDLS